MDLALFFNSRYMEIYCLVNMFLSLYLQNFDDVVVRNAADIEYSQDS